MTTTLLTTFIIGLIAASPIGPMGLLCLRRAFLQGTRSAIISATGIAAAYLFWSFVATHGLSSFSHWIEQKHQPLEISIGLFFFLYGLHAIFNSPKTDYPTLQTKSELSEFFSTFLVVFLNPSTFVVFTALFTLFGISKSHYDLLNSVEIALSVFAGSLLFWIITTRIVSHIKSRINDALFIHISRVSAVAITLFGISVFIYSLWTSP